MAKEDMTPDRYTTDVNGELIQDSNGELIHYGDYLEMQQKYIKLMERASKVIDKAFGYDGDVFGILHNYATDVLSELEQTCKLVQSKHKSHPRCKKHG